MVTVTNVGHIFLSKYNLLIAQHVEECKGLMLVCDPNHIKLV